MASANKLRLEARNRRPPLACVEQRCQFAMFYAWRDAERSFTIRIVPIDLDNLPGDTVELQQRLRTVLLQHSALHAENDKLRLLICG